MLLYQGIGYHGVMNLMLKFSIILLVILKAIPSIAAPNLLHYHYRELSFDYPATLKLTPYFTQQYLFQNTWTVVSNAPNNSKQKPWVELMIVNQQFKTQDLGMQTVLVSFRIASSTELANVHHCYQPKNVRTMPDKMIDGRIFKSFSFSDAAMMKVLNAMIYRYKKNKICYSVEILSAYPNANSAVIDQTVQQGNKTAQSILNSIRLGSRF